MSLHGLNRLATLGAKRNHMVKVASGRCSGVFCSIFSSPLINLLHSLSSVGPLFIYFSLFDIIDVHHTFLERPYELNFCFSFEIVESWSSVYIHKVNT